MGFLLLPLRTPNVALKWIEENLVNDFPSKYIVFTGLTRKGYRTLSQ